MLDGIQLRHDLRQLLVTQVEGDTPDTVDAAQEAGPSQLVIELHDPLLHPATMRMSQHIGGIIADRADVPQVIVQPLELEKEAAEVAGPARHVDSEEGFDRLAVGETVADGRISRHPLGERDRRRQPLLLEQLLDPPVLPEMAQLELHDRFAGHGKPEMSRFDDPRMDRPDRHLEHPLALDVTERVLPLCPIEHGVP